jgi:hypothetical protein
VPCSFARKRIAARYIKSRRNSNNKDNVVHLLSPDNVTATPFADGDAALIIKASGKVELVNCFDLTNNATEQDIETMEKLVALAAALNIPTVMDMLLKLVRDPKIFTDGLINYGPKQ